MARLAYDGKSGAKNFGSMGVVWDNAHGPARFFCFFVLEMKTSLPFASPLTGDAQSIGITRSASSKP
jgi:hypothetical protein